MADGRLTVCKECVKTRVREREAKLRKNKDWVEKERKRSRDKFMRLNYKVKYLTNPKEREKWNRKYPEKVLCHKKFDKSPMKGYNYHHWSYNEEHYFDVIELSIKDHNRLHHYLKYDQSVFMYRTLEGKLLDTREKHIEYMEAVFKLPY